MTLRNTSATTAIENVKMVVSSAADETTGGVFTPANSSNSFYIDPIRISIHLHRVDRPDGQGGRQP